MEGQAVKPYTLNEYQADAKRTMAKRQLDFFNLAVAGLGITGEAGEVADYIKKVVSHGHEFDAAKLKAELGDLMWYISMLATLMEVPLEDIAHQNIEKLRKRYPKGFEAERSINRED
jgi:NTP pyrophosphatase (non-canonical NTP hydrolase)